MLPDIFTHRIRFWGGGLGLKICKGLTRELMFQSILIEIKQIPLTFPCFLNCFPEVWQGGVEKERECLKSGVCFSLPSLAPALNIASHGVFVNKTCDCYSEFQIQQLYEEHQKFQSYLDLFISVERMSHQSLLLKIGHTTLEGRVIKQASFWS